MPSIRSHDQGFVPAAPAQVYEVLADPGSYPSWWPGAQPSPEGVVLPLRRGLPPSRTDRLRDGLGLHLLSDAQDLEWYLEPFDDGTIVNVLVDVPDAPPGRRGERRLLRMRGAVRRGLVGLKRRFEETR
ncbi:MAG: hypothetical protein LC722_08910 [Actinobacteria bacterium]|nr:hypothetical protein [Actinomycetota bacterium]